MNIDRTTITLVLYVMGSLCFLAGSLLTLWTHLK